MQNGEFAVETEAKDDAVVGRAAASSHSIKIPVDLDQRAIGPSALARFQTEGVHDLDLALCVEPEERSMAVLAASQRHAVEQTIAGAQRRAVGAGALVHGERVQL